jgi:hypothetical protein
MEKLLELLPKVSVPTTIMQHRMQQSYRRLLLSPNYCFRLLLVRSILYGIELRSSEKMLLLDTLLSRLTLPCLGCLIFPCACPPKHFIMSLSIEALLFALHVNHT